MDCLYFMKVIRNLCWRSVTAAFAAANLFFLITTPYTAGEPVLLEPKLSLQQEYIDNIMFVNDGSQNDYITTVSPAFSVKQKTPRFNGDLTAGVDAIYYKDFDELNSVDKHSTASLNYSFTELLQLGVSAGYLEDSRSDRQIDDTGLILSGDREQSRGAVSGQYQFSEVMEIGFSGGYITEDINSPGKDIFLENGENNDTVTAQVSLSRNISKLLPNTTALFDVSYMNYKSEYPSVREIAYKDLPDDILVVIVDPQDGSTPTGLLQNFSAESDYDVWNITAGFSREMSERFSFFLKGGSSCFSSDETSRLSITASDTLLYDTASSFSSGTTWGWLLFTGISYKGIYDRIDANISRDIRTASGLNGTTERSSVSLNYTRKITEKLSTRLSGNCYLNQSDRERSADIDELTLNGSAGFTYKISNFWNGSLNWNYVRVEDRENDIWRDRNRIYARIIKTFEL